MVPDSVLLIRVQRFLFMKCIPRKVFIPDSMMWGLGYTESTGGVDGVYDANTVMFFSLSD